MSDTDFSGTDLRFPSEMDGDKVVVFQQQQQICTICNAWQCLVVGCNNPCFVAACVNHGCANAKCQVNQPRGLVQG